MNSISRMQAQRATLEGAGTDAIELLGTRFHNVSLPEFLSHIDQCVQARQSSYVVTPNIDHIVRLESDLEFQRAYRHAYLVVCDSKPLMWAARLLGVKLKQKLSGSDLVHWLSAHAAARGYGVFLFGAADGVAELAARKLQDRYPGLRVLGFCSPGLGFHNDPAANDAALGEISRAAPDLCFIALGSPKQEKWMCDNIEASGVPVMIGIGAGLDFVVGRFKRAPAWMQQCGLEWLWRLCSDPRRLFKRYIIDDSRFFLIVLREWRRTRRRRSLAQ